jgi:uncharacterized membrane protein YiaA
MMIIFEVIPVFIPGIWNSRYSLDDWEYFLRALYHIRFLILLRNFNLIMNRRRRLHDLPIIEPFFLTSKEILRGFTLLSLLPAP